jgi:SAM-dependent methyltransferase
MDKTVFATFREIVGRLRVEGRVLEVGAVPNDDSLLTLDVLEGQERIGVNIDGGVRYRDFDIVAANANDLSMFGDGSFDCVLSNATIEHDPFFWKTCSEIRRVLRVGGVAVIGAPGYTADTSLKALGCDQPQFAEDALHSWTKSTLALHVHGAPDDYYRFSPSAFRDVIFEGYSGIEIVSVMVPPRIIGYGFKT